MGMRSQLDPLFAAIDARDTAAFLGFLTDDAVFRFGSASALRGHGEIGAAVDGFFATIAGSRHRVERVMVDGQVLICEGQVTYRRQDESEVTLPFVNVLEFDQSRIRDYRIYIDLGPLFGAPAS